MRRKLTAALLTAAMAISLTACGGSGDTASAGASTGETASVTEAGATTTASGKEVLRVAMSADYAPFDWLQEDDSNGAVMTSNGSYMNGYDVLVAKYIAEKLDMDLEITQIDWDGLILSIQSGKVDCAIAGMSITSERSQSVDFSDPYYNANIVAVVAADGPYADAVNVTDFEGATLTSTLNTVWYDALDQITDYATKDAALDTFASMVAAVHAGKINGFTSIALGDILDNSFFKFPLISVRKKCNFLSLLSKKSFIVETDIFCIKRKYDCVSRRVNSCKK